MKEVKISSHDRRDKCTSSSQWLWLDELQIGEELFFFSFPQDSVWGGTGSSSHYQSNHTSVQQQQQRFETVTSGKKKKKQKMVRADPSLLGETINHLWNLPTQSPTQQFGAPFIKLTHEFLLFSPTRLHTNWFLELFLSWWLLNYPVK